MKISSAISGAKLASIFDILEEHNINTDLFLDSLQIDERLFGANQRKLTVSEVKILLEKAVCLTNDQDLGLHLGERSRFLPNIVCYIMMNCLTVKDALQKYSQYKKIFSDETIVQFKITHQKAELVLNSAANELASLRAFSDYKLTTMYMFLRFLTGGKLNINSVSLKHPEPDNISQYEKVFPCPVLFSQSVDSLSFNKETLDQLIKSPNKDLLDYFEQYAKNILNKISENESWARKVSKLLINTLQGGESPSVELIAMKLNMSVRKLQGLLEQEGTTYKQLFQSVREQLALVYLNDRQLSSSEVSYLLGFSDPSSFFRAFKKWTGNTPGQFKTIQ